MIIANSTLYAPPSLASLRSKRFRGVWEQRKAEERDSRPVFCPREKWGEVQKKKEGIKPKFLLANIVQDPVV